MIAKIPDEYRADVETLWQYHDLGHEQSRSDIGIGWGCHDIGVAEHTAALYHKAFFPMVVFTGANAPTTISRSPRGEAVHFRERAIELGVPARDILVERRAGNTGENITFTRRLLCSEGIAIQSATLITRPYQQRRACATAQRNGLS